MSANLEVEISKIEESRYESGGENNFSSEILVRRRNT